MPPEPPEAEGDVSMKPMGGLPGAAAWLAAGILAGVSAGVFLPPLAHAQSPLDSAVQAVLGSQGSEGSTEVGESEKPGEDAPALPGIEDLVPRALKVQAEAGEAEAQARKLGEIEDVRASLGEIEPEARRLTGRSAEDAAPAAGLSGELASLTERLRSSSDRLRGRLQDLEALRSKWREAERLWSDWRDRLTGQERPSLADEAERSRSRIAEVLTTVDEAVERVLGAQRRVELLRRDLEALSRRLDTGLGGGEELAGSRDAPLLGSRRHREELRKGPLRPLLDGAAALSWPDPLFWARHYRPLLFQLLLCAGVIFLARYFRSWSRLGEEWTGILQHPWALGIFIATAPSNLLYESPPPLWRLLLWSLFAAASVVLAAVTFKSAGKRWGVYGMAVAFTLFLVLEALGLPGPWLRLVVAAIGAVGVGLLLLAGRRAARDEEDRRGFRLLVRVAAVLLAVVLGAEILGYDRFARSLLESALASAFVVLVVTLALRLGRGAIHGTVFRLSGRFPWLRRVGHRLAGRLSWLFKALVILVGLVEGAVLWGLFDSPTEALSTLWSWNLGLGLGSLRLGQVLLALVALYLAFLVSIVLRSTLEGEVLAKREMDPGVSTAITTLVHYLLVTVGFFVALAFVGANLDNLTLVIGALGVGVGLGLQDLVKNFFSGLVLLFERPVRVGDTVILEGEWATVQKIGLRATTVTTFDRSEIIVPNGVLTSEKVTNWTLSDQVSRLLVPVGVAYGSDLETVFRLLQEAAAEHPNVLEEPAPLVLFVGFGDSSLDFELRVWIGSMDQRLPTRSELHADIDRRFRENGVTIPFPQRDLYLKSMPGASAGSRLERPERPEGAVVSEAVRSNDLE